MFRAIKQERDKGEIKMESCWSVSFVSTCVAREHDGLVGEAGPGASGARYIYLVIVIT